MIFRFIAFGLIGMAIEVALKGLWKMITTQSLDMTGESSLVKFPFYGIISIIYPILFHQIKDLQWYVRGGIYAIIFTVGEFIVIKLLERMRINFDSDIKEILMHAVIWFFVGLGIEFIYPLVLSASRQGI